MSDSPGHAHLSAEREWAFDAVESVSRTFALSIDLLEEPMRSWICTGYLLCRIADTIEDEPRIPLEHRARLLDTYESMLDPEEDVDTEEFLRAAAEPPRPEDDPEWEVVDGTDRVMGLVGSFDPEVSAAMRATSREMADGMAGFLRRYDREDGLRLQTVEELEEYCWYVAGTVGELFTRLLDHRDVGWSTPPDPADARAFALLLQLVNIAKDVGVDRETEDNVYLPERWLAEEGISHAAVGRRASDDVTRVVERVVEHAAGYADGARRYLETLPAEEGRVLESLALPYLLALGTVRELRARPADTLTQTGVKLGREEVETLYARMQGGVTQADVTRLADLVEEGVDPAALRE